jgi:AraC family transcriptional activator of mtrCDE
MHIEPMPVFAGSARPPSVEPALESLLNHSMLRVDIVAELEYCGEWFMDEPRYDCGLFHLVGTGECLVESASLTEALHLQAGDLVVLPHGDPHRLYARDGDKKNATSLICGELHFSSRTRHPPSVTDLFCGSRSRSRQGVPASDIHDGGRCQFGYGRPPGSVE